MKRINITRAGLLLLLFFSSLNLFAGSPDSAKAELNLNLRYFLHNNKVQYLTVESNTKVARKFEPVKGIKVKVYLGEVAPENLLGNVVTDDKGKAMVIIPPAKKAAWNASNQHTFIGVAAPTPKFDETTSELEITKARLVMATDTAGGTKAVKVALEELKDDNTWAPVEEAEMKVGIKRLNTVLPVGTDETYTTDSAGIALAEFTRNNLPGDQKGNLTLIANVADNDTYGNLVLEKNVPWGVAAVIANDFDKRSLFATRDKAPYWLLFLSGLIFFTVWGTIVYLVVLLMKIRNLGKARPVEEPAPLPVALSPVAE